MRCENQNWFIVYWWLDAVFGLDNVCQAPGFSALFLHNYIQLFEQYAAIRYLLFLFKQVCALLPDTVLEVQCRGWLASAGILNVIQINADRPAKVLTLWQAGLMS